MTVLMTLQEFRNMNATQQINAFAKMHKFLIWSGAIADPTLKILYFDTQYLVRSIIKEYKLFREIYKVKKIDLSDEDDLGMYDVDKIHEWVARNGITDIKNIDMNLVALFKLQVKLWAEK